MTQSVPSRPSPTPATDPDRPLREHLLAVLRGGHAHMPLAEAVAGFPADRINAKPPHVDYTFWHLVEHVRITQADILDYVTNEAYQAPEWPRGYWPAPDAEATQAAWDASIAAFERDLEALAAIVADEATDLFAAVPSQDGHTILREILIVADHNAYHIGELGILRQVAGAWGPGHTG